MGKLRIAVASPFVDRLHGTERALAELLSRLATQRDCEVHLYSQRVEGLEVAPHTSDDGGRITWRRVPFVPGPHVVQFLGWYLLNRLWRWWDRRFRGLRFDVVFSPGINCSDADVILVHAVFHRLAELQHQSPAAGLRGLHRRFYYRIMGALERRIYTDRRVKLAAVSRHTAEQLSRYFGRDDVTIVPNGVDAAYFSPAELAPVRDVLRRNWSFQQDEKVLLLIGNDWRTKGLPTLFEAAALCRDLPLRLVAVGQENPEPFRAQAQKLGIANRVSFASPDSDVRRFYAVADIFVAASLEDSFNLPALEAMSCGLPVIVSTNAGISEWVNDRENAALLRDPRDAGELAAAIRNLATDAQRVRLLSGNAVRTAKTLSWDHHASAVRELLDIRLGKRSSKS